MKDRLDRDDALARLAAPLMPRDVGASAGQCPDADVIGAYLDRSLDAADRAKCEDHFAGCARCQGVLAGLARLEPPAPHVAPTPSPSAPWLWRFRWQWLAPAAAVLAVGIVWTVVRPVSGPVAPTMTRSEVPAAVPRAGAWPEQSLAQADAQRNAPAQFAPEKETPRPATPPADERLRLQAGSKDLASATPARKDKREAPAAPAPVVAGNVTEEPAPARARAALAVQKAAEVPKPAAAPAPAERGAYDAVGASRSDAARLVSAAGAPAPVRFATSPTQDVSWRIGPAGSIERSIDGRRTWQKQDSGTTATLTAISAASDTVCWIVGQRGTVLRTTDGQTWETLASPALVDLVSVSAGSHLVATVVAADGRRYVTTDGGRTWKVT